MKAGRTPRRARRGPPTTSDGLARERIVALDKLLKDDAIGGRLDHDPDFRDRILAHGFNALHELVVMAHDPQYPPSVRALAMFKAGDHTLLPLKAIDAAAEVGPTAITVMVAPWAAVRPPTSALPAPEPLDHEEAMHGDMRTPSTPYLSDRDRLRAQVRAAAETVIIEAPAQPNQPQRVIARVSQATGVQASPSDGVLSREEIMERLSRGPQG